MLQDWFPNTITSPGCWKLDANSISLPNPCTPTTSNPAGANWTGRHWAWEFNWDVLISNQVGDLMTCKHGGCLFEVRETVCESDDRAGSAPVWSHDRGNPPPFILLLYRPKLCQRQTKNILYFTTAKDNPVKTAILYTHHRWSHYTHHNLFWFLFKFLPVCKPTTTISTEPLAGVVHHSLQTMKEDRLTRSLFCAALKVYYCAKLLKRRQPLAPTTTHACQLVGTIANIYTQS